MKALIFTLDSIFSLTIAAVGISALLFFTYLAQVPYPVHYSNAQAILSALLSSSVDSVRNSSALAYAMTAQFSGSNQTSPQFLGGTNQNSSGRIGPTEPMIAYSYLPGNTISTGVVADYGNFYFAANAILYSVNATTNTTVWVRNTITNVMSTSALYAGMVYYANMTNLTSVDARTGSIVWSINAVSLITTPITVYENKVVVGTADSNLRAYSAYNGTLLWSTSAVDVPKSIAMIKGNAEVETLSGNVVSVVQNAASANLLTSTTYSLSNAPTYLATSGSVVYLGTGSGANAITPNGVPVNGFPISTSNTISGVSVYKGYVVYQTFNSIVAVSPSGTPYWRVSVPPSFGIANSNAIPVVTGTMIYTLWANGLAGQNLTTGVFQWFSLLPTGNTLPYMSLAYGRLYVTSNNRVIAYGPCRVPVHSSLLLASGTLLINGQPGCASALLNSAYPIANYSLFAANASSRVIRTASFSGSGNYISAKNFAQLNTSFVTVSFWMNATALNANGMRPVNYGDNGTLVASNYCGWFFYLFSNGMIQFAIGNNGVQYTVNGPIISLKKWYHVVGSYNGSALSLVVNDGSPASTAKTGVIGLTTPSVNLVVGGVSGNYFTGNIANLQVYSRPLSTTQISQLYLRGVQGVPIDVPGLVAWYPFAGDTNDYAMFDTAYATGATFVTKTYVSPALSGAFDIARASTLLPLRNYTTGVTNTMTVGVFSWS